MEGCSKTSAGAVAGLPDDPLVEILSRVPAKSVCRFKCVSKAWRDLIAHPDHRKKLRQPMQGLFLQTSEVSEVDNTRLAPTSFSFVDLTVRSVPLDIDPCFSFLTELTGIQNLFFQDSCNGFILFSQHKGLGLLSDDVLGYVVCNPTTKQWSAVPPRVSDESLTCTYLAFAPAMSSHFHLVQFHMPDPHEEIVLLHVYSSETGTWSQNQIDEQKVQGQLDWWRCAYVNGFIHVIFVRSDLQHILAVDVQGKARRMIALPGMADGRPGHASIWYLGQSQGHLHCVTLETADYKTDKLSIWVLQDYGTEEWVLKNTVDCDSLGVFGETAHFSEFELVDFHQDCNVVFFLQSSKLIAYNMDRKEVSVIATFRHYKCRFRFVRYVPYFSESPALTNKY